MINRRRILFPDELTRDRTHAAAAGDHAQARALAAAAVPVHLHGETGSGKSLLARRIHDASSRRHLEFREFHCQAASPFDTTFGLMELLDDAAGRRIGTIHIEEVDTLTVPGQLVLLAELRAIGCRRGGSPRLIASSARPLSDAVAAGRFSAELRERLAPIEVHLPPLRQQRHRIRPLASAFLDERAGGGEGGAPILDPDALAALWSYGWPGNVRQLRNAVEHALVFAERGRIRLADLPAEIARASRPGRPAAPCHEPSRP